MYHGIILCWALLGDQPVIFGGVIFNCKFKFKDRKVKKRTLQIKTLEIGL